MDYYYVSIDGNEYFLPDAVFLGMEDETANYIQSKYDKKYVAISKMKSDGNYPLMKKTYDRCNNWVGMSLFETPEGDDFSKMGYIFRNIDMLSDMCIKKGNISKACDLLENGIELSLKSYNQAISKESSKGTTK
jgi:hypothetical protein